MRHYVFFFFFLAYHSETRGRKNMGENDERVSFVLVTASLPFEDALRA